MNSGNQKTKYAETPNGLPGSAPRIFERLLRAAQMAAMWMAVEQTGISAARRQAVIDAIGRHRDHMAPAAAR